MLIKFVVEMDIVGCLGKFAVDGWESVMLVFFIMKEKRRILLLFVYYENHVP